MELVTVTSLKFRMHRFHTEQKYIFYSKMVYISVRKARKISPIFFSFWLKPPNLLVNVKITTMI